MIEKGGYDGFGGRRDLSPGDVPAAARHLLALGNVVGYPDHSGRGYRNRGGLPGLEEQKQILGGGV